MSFIAPYAFTGAVSLYLGYKTYTSYYSNYEFEEIGNEENEEIKEVVNELVESIIQDAVEKIQEEQDKILYGDDVVDEELPVKREEIKKDDEKINKIIEKFKKE